MISSLITAAAIAFLWMVFQRKAVDARALLSVSAFYLLFAVLIVSYFTHRWEHIPAADHARANPLAAQPQAIAAGAAAFRSNCQQCHRADARGDGKLYPSLRSARLRKATDGDIEWFLRQGENAQGMPSWAALPESERWQIVAYLRTIQ